MLRCVPPALSLFSSPESPANVESRTPPPRVVRQRANAGRPRPVTEREPGHVVRDESCPARAVRLSDPDFTRTPRRSGQAQFRRHLEADRPGRAGGVHTDRADGGSGRHCADGHDDLADGRVQDVLQARWQRRAEPAGIQRHDDRSDHEAGLGRQPADADHHVEDGRAAARVQFGVVAGRRWLAGDPVDGP